MFLKKISILTAVVFALSSATADAVTENEYFSTEEVQQLLDQGISVDTSKLEGEVYTSPIIFEEQDETGAADEQPTDQLTPEFRTGACIGKNVMWKHPRSPGQITYWMEATCYGGDFLPLSGQAGLERKTGWLRFERIDETDIEDNFQNTVLATGVFICDNTTPQTYRVWGKVWAGPHRGFGYSEEEVLKCG